MPGISSICIRRLQQCRPAWDRHEEEKNKTDVDEGKDHDYKKVILPNRPFP